MADASEEIEQRLPPSPYPRLEALFRLGERVWHDREDLKRAFPDIRSSEFWYWLMWHGTDHYPEIRSELYPLPGKDLTGRVVGENASAQDFHRGGLVNWRRVDRCLRDAGFDYRHGGRVLDFGCGCGRILRFFGRYAGSCSFHGTDIDSSAVAWCADHLDFASFSLQAHEPPCAYDAGTFDAVYAYSVFSHLPEARHRAWLAELRRITRPGAIVVLTVQGYHVMEMVSAGDRDLGSPSAAELRARSAELERTGFAFFPYRTVLSPNAEIETIFGQSDLQEYGNTFILEPYVRREWARFFDVQTIHPAPDDWQDFVVLKRR